MPLASHLFLLIFLPPSSSGDGKAHFPSTCLLPSLMMSKKQRQEWVHRVRVLGLSKLSIVALRVVLGQTRSSLTSCGYHPALLSEWVKWKDEWTDITGELWWWGVTAGPCYCLNEPMSSFMFLSWWYCLLRDAAGTLGSGSLPEEVGD